MTVVRDIWQMHEFFARPPKSDKDVASLVTTANDPDPEDYASDDEGQDDDRVAPEVVASDAAAVQEVVDAVEMEGRLRAMTENEVMEGKLAVTKVSKPLCTSHWILMSAQVCKLSTKSHWNSSVSEDMKAACVESKIDPPKKLVRDIEVGWKPSPVCSLMVCAL